MLHTSIINRQIWFVILALAAVDALIMLIAGFELDWSTTPPMFTALAVLAVIWAFYTRIRPDERISQLMQAFMQVVAFTGVSALFSYLCAALNYPLMDEYFIAFDKALGFDWLAHVKWVATHPWISSTLYVAYLSIAPQLLVSIVVLIGVRQFVELQRLIIAFMLEALISIVISALLPAVAGYVYYGLDPAAFNHPAAARVHELHYLGVRDGSMRTLVLGGAQGIITFPSFHVAMGLMMMWTARLSRWTLIPSVVLNLLMCISAISQGGHWLADVLGGAVVAVLAVWLARKWVNARSGDETKY